MIRKFLALVQGSDAPPAQAGRRQTTTHLGRTKSLRFFRRCLDDTNRVGLSREIRLCKQSISHVQFACARTVEHEKTTDLPGRGSAARIAGYGELEWMCTSWLRAELQYLSGAG
jgi:hypothetical protein